MARKPRKEPTAEFHHITNQGARREDIYIDDEDRHRFFELVGMAHHKYGMTLHANCLMGNHYHLLAQFPERNMPQVMHWLGTCYSQQINRRHGFTGRLCRDRYFNEPIHDDAYLIAASRYIHRNPIDLGVPTNALDEYWASSYGAYLGETSAPPWLRTDLVLGIFGNDRTSLRRFTEEPLPTDAAAG